MRIPPSTMQHGMRASAHAMHVRFCMVVYSSSPVSCSVLGCTVILMYQGVQSGWSRWDRIIGCPTPLEPAAGAHTAKTVAKQTHIALRDGELLLVKQPYRRSRSSPVSIRCCSCTANPPPPPTNRHSPPALLQRASVDRPCL